MAATRASTRRGILLSAVLALMAFALAAMPAGANAGSFDGTCTFKGTVRFSPPATNAQQSLEATYDAAGTCTGTLNGHSISNAAASAHNVARDVDGSCAHADTTRPGSGAIRFADGTLIGFSSEFHFVGTNGTFTLRGERSGSAHGIGSFVTDRSSPDVVLQCAGAGVASAPLDLSVVTDGPLVGGPSAAGHDGGAQRRASTFSGRCQLSGRVTFHPPLTNDPHAVRQRVRAPGTCSGTLRDRRGRTHDLSNAPASFSESSGGAAASCAAGTAEGHGALRFGHVKIRFAFSEKRAGGTAVGTATGRRSGSAHGIAAVSPSEDPAAIAQACAASGLQRAKIEIQLTTTPSISG